MVWHVYMVRCKTGSLYTGIAKDLAKRFSEHQSQGPRCAKYLRGKTPLTLAYSEETTDRSAASKREYALKQLSKKEKEALIVEASPMPKDSPIPLLQHTDSL